MGLDFKEILSAFIVLFAVIDITGSIPVIIGLKTKNVKIEPMKTALISLALFIVFLFGGIQILGFLNVDIQSFAVAGSLLLFIMALEMVFGVVLFKTSTEAAVKTALVPLVFPLIAGAASFTTLLSLKAEYELINIIIAIVLNMAVVYVVLKRVNIIERVLGKGGVFILQKFFGIVLLAMSVRLFVANITTLLGNING